MNMKKNRRQLIEMAKIIAKNYKEIPLMISEIIIDYLRQILMNKV